MALAASPEPALQGRCQPPARGAQPDVSRGPGRPGRRSEFHRALREWSPFRIGLHPHWRRTGIAYATGHAHDQFIGSHQARAKSATGVKVLANGPLTGLALAVAVRAVVEAGVAEHRFQRIGLP